ATKTVSGVFYYGFRYYVPELGRFINRDLIGELDPKLVDSLLQRSGRENSESEKKQIEALVGAENLVYFSASGSRSEGSLNQYDIEGARFPYLFCHNDGINQQDLYGLGGPLIPAGVVLAIGIGGFLAESTVNVCICMSLDYGEEIVTQTPLTRLAQMTSAILNAIGTASCSYGTEPLWRKRIWRDSSGDCDGRYELRCF
ncbi:MAG: hypothetical protein P1U81_18385, partial [Verrucomicrobiales bacterium]|nr:hypothetical protein [Verrucomicrobiales bacterium]